MAKIDKKFKANWKKYIYQCGYASLAVFIVLLFLQLRNMVAVASIGASAFIIFTMPNSRTAQSKNIMGGYVIGLISGTIFSFVPGNLFFARIIVYSLAVGFSIFLMVITDTEHPPASGIALSIAINGFTVETEIIVLFSAVALAIINSIFKKYLEDLV